MIHIGIDGGKKTGIAVWSGRAFIQVCTLDFWGAFNFVKGFSKDRVKVYVEDPNMIKTMYSRNRDKEKFQLAKIAQNVGGVKKESDLLAEGLKRAGYTVARVKPAKSKKNAAAIKTLTNYSKRTNQHERDAMMLVYGY